MFEFESEFGTLTHELNACVRYSNGGKTSGTQAAVDECVSPFMVSCSTIAKTVAICGPSLLA